MKLSQFKFKLPDDKVALEPPYHRDECKLMVVHRKTGEIEHRLFKDIIDYFDDGDSFIFNDTRVFPARLYGNKEKTGARIEVFLLRERLPFQRLERDRDLRQVGRGNDRLAALLGVGVQHQLEGRLVEDERGDAVCALGRVLDRLLGLVG